MCCMMMMITSLPLRICAYTHAYKQITRIDVFMCVGARVYIEYRRMANVDASQTLRIYTCLRVS